MANILFVYERKMPTTEGIHEIFNSEEAKEYGICAQFVTVWRVNQELLCWADGIVFVRTLDLLSQWILRRAKERGLFTIQFFDDDVLNLPKNAVRRVQYLSWRKRAIDYGFKNTDIILSSNQLLAKKYSEKTVSRRFAIINTVVDEKVLIPIFKREQHYLGNKVRIVYAAGANHENMFYKYILPNIPYLIKKYKNRISFTFFGVHPDMSEYQDQIEVNYIGALSLSQYRKEIQSGYYDIGLAPLESNEFTQYKYYNKYIEYTIAGTVGIYSKVLPYTLVVKDKENGFLAFNSTEGWLDTLSEAIEHSEMRRMCYRNAYNHIRNELKAGAIFDKLKRDIPEPLQVRQVKVKMYVVDLKVKYLAYRFLEGMYLIFDYMRKEGICGTVKKVISFWNDWKNSRTEKLGE